MISRSNGKLQDSDYLAASSIAKNKKFIIPKNVVFLHIFKDSPFGSIDKKRIFFDYFHWIIETIRILKDSNEMWSLRTHPNNKIWGENSYELLKEIERKYFNGKFPKNIQIDNREVSNLDVFNKILRCVTYSGTASIESSCYGIKPIIISNNSLSEINNKNVIKPRNINEYRNFLLKRSSDKIFIQSKEKIEESKYLLFSLYNILSFKKDLNVTNFFSKSSNKNIKENLTNLLYALDSKFCNDKLKLLGVFLKKNKTRTISFKFFDLL